MEYLRRWNCAGCGWSNRSTVAADGRGKCVHCRATLPPERVATLRARLARAVQGMVSIRSGGGRDRSVLAGDHPDDPGRREAFERLQTWHAQARDRVLPTSLSANLEWMLRSRRAATRYAEGLDGKMIDLMEVLLKQLADQLEACAPTRCSEAVSLSLSRRASHDLVALGLAEATENFFLVFRRVARTSARNELTLV